MSPEADAKSVKEPEVACDRQECESSRLVRGPCGCVARVAARLDNGDVHPMAPHVLRRELRQLRADPPPLIVGVDADDLDDAHPLMERIQGNADETNRASKGDGNEDIKLGIRTTRTDSLCLTRSPVRME